jgi:putative oxidoreductase
MEHLHRLWGPLQGGRTGWGLLLLRFIVGLAFVFHGWGKVQDPAAFAAGAGLPVWVGALVGWTEFLGGVMLIVGLLTPVAALGIAAVMMGALALVHMPAGDPFVSPMGRNFETAGVYLFTMGAILLTGPGAYSLDALWLRRSAGATTRAPAAGRRRGTV